MNETKATRTLASATMSAAGKLATAITLCLLGLVAAIASQAQSPPLLTRHVRDVTVSGQARSVGHLPAAQSMRLTLILPLRNQAALDDLLHDLYNPSGSSYRHFLSVDEFTEMFGPTPEDYDAVTRWAEAKGFTVVGTSLNRLNLDVTGTVANIEAAFHLTMGLYQHPTENRTFYAADREPTPDLAVQLWHISGLDNYSIPKPALVRKNAGEAPLATTGSGPSASFLGSDMRAAYYGGALTGSGQSLGLLEFHGTDLADLDTYYKNVGQTNNVPITLLSTDGTSTSCVEPSCDDLEQTIDMTQALGMAPGLSSLVMYIASYPHDADIFNAMATHSPLNAQLSSSWTWIPADPNTDNPYFEEFAAQGQNLFQAAGDSAKWGTSSEIYPADDVYLTSVGGTDLETTGPAGPWASESAWADGGGGISPDEFAIPFWQTAAATGCSGCSQTYRNGPDVSANANNTFYVCADQGGDPYFGGQECGANIYGGTSFAAPMWAGYLALINQQVVANTGTTVGFINPTIYAIGEGITYNADFHDITSGSNGYPATVGYDLATGWGSPNGSGLINALWGSRSTFQALSTSEVFVLQTNDKLWLESAPFGNPVEVDGSVWSFQALSTSQVLVLGMDGKLWLESAPFGNPPPAREQVDGSVQSFQALSSTQVFVLGTNGKLWLESAPFGNPPPARVQVDGSVRAFHAFSATQVLVLGTDGKLWLESAPFGNPPPARVELDGSVQSFQALSATQVLVLATNGKLWLESAPFGTVPPPSRVQVDGSVESFQALSAAQVFVLGTDGKLWLESAPFGNPPPARVQVDGSVMAFQALSSTETVVLGTNGVLWLESAPWGTIPPTRVEIDASVL